MKEYTKKLYICGDRNSYSRTDHDATFMRMKEDAMGNGQLKAGYNIQHGVDSEYITWLTAGPQPTDMTMLIPFFKELERITSEKGIQLRLNRSIQSEGSFGDLKEDTCFRRFRYRGKANVCAFLNRKAEMDGLSECFIKISNRKGHIV